MELYATGDNAWNQLSFEAADESTEPQDVFAFKRILHAQKIHWPIISRLSYTQAHTEKGRHVAGFNLWHVDGIGDEAGNGQLLESADGHTLEHWPSRRSKALKEGPRILHTQDKIKSIASYDTGFVILYENGTVATAGDARFGDCLGREVSCEEPADEAHIVHELAVLDDPVVQVAAGGYTLGALTASGALYAWGTRAPGSDRCARPLFESLTETPNYIEVDGGKDVREFGIGESHAIALTTDGCVYVVGSNANGQIGLGHHVKDSSVEAWRVLDFPLPVDRRIVGVTAGPRTSFILTAAKDKG